MHARTHARRGGEAARDATPIYFSDIPSSVAQRCASSRSAGLLSTLSGLQVGQHFSFGEGGGYWDHTEEGDETEARLIRRDHRIISGGKTHTEKLTCSMRRT